MLVFLCKRVCVRQCVDESAHVCMSPGMLRVYPAVRARAGLFWCAASIAPRGTNRCLSRFSKMGSCSEEERLRAQQEITAKEEMLAAERRERQRLAAQLAAMEEKLVVGHADEETVRKREEDLLRAQVELEERRREQEVLNERLREKEEMAAENESKYADIKEEAEVKTKKLKKLWKKYEETKREVDELQQEFRDERDELYESVREQERQLKLLNLIVNNFVPPEEKRKLESRCIYDEVCPHTRSLLHGRSLALTACVAQRAWHACGINIF